MKRVTFTIILEGHAYYLRVVFKNFSQLYLGLLCAFKGVDSKTHKTLEEFFYQVTGKKTFLSFARFLESQAIPVEQQKP